MSLRNISVRARNLLGFGLLGLILLVTGGVALKEIQGLKHEVLEMRDEWMLGLDWVAQMKSDRQNIRLKESLVLTLPDQVDSLASDSDWHNNACLNYMPDHGTTYTEGYRRAADILIKHIDESGLDQDFLVYPVLFLYRHHIELLIKQIVGLALVLSEEPDTDQYKKDNHNLNTLWLLAKKLLPEVTNSGF